MLALLQNSKSFKKTAVSQSRKKGHKYEFRYRQNENITQNI